MALPTFNGSPLFSKSASDLPGAVDVRIQTETLPGVDGEYVQPHGNAGRDIIANGWLEASGNTPALAHAALKTLLRARQNAADGATVATYVGTDGHDYDNCLLLSYAPTATVETTAGGGTFRAVVPIRAVFRQVAPQ